MPLITGFPGVAGIVGRYGRYQNEYPYGWPYG